VVPSARINKETQMVIYRVGPLSCAKIVGTLYAVIGLFAGAAFSLFALAGGFVAENSPMAGFGAMLGIGAVSAIIALPIFYGLLGFVTTLIGAWIYNVVASAVGGVELDIR